MRKVYTLKELLYGKKKVQKDFVGYIWVPYIPLIKTGLISYEKEITKMKNLSRG